MSDKVEKVLTRLGNIWPKRLDDDSVSEWLADWESALKRFEPWVIDAAATRLIQSRTKPGFPVPREMIDACNEVVADDRRSKPQLSQTTPSYGDPYKLADELIRCDLGKRAAREGWALTLRDFIVKESRLPSESEIRKLIGIRDKFLMNLRDCQNGRGGMIGGDLAKLGKSMARREYEIAQRLLGDQAFDWYAGKLGKEAA